MQRQDVEIKACSVIGANNGTAYLLGELHQAGLADVRIADMLGVTRMTIHRWKHNISHPRPSGAINKELANLLHNCVKV